MVPPIIGVCCLHATHDSAYGSATLLAQSDRAANVPLLTTSLFIDRREHIARHNTGRTPHFSSIAYADVSTNGLAGLSSNPSKVATIPNALRRPSDPLRS